LGKEHRDRPRRAGALVALTDIDEKAQQETAASSPARKSKDQIKIKSLRCQ